MKIDIPKNLWLSSAEVDFFKEGLYSGAYGLTLNFTGNGVGSIELMTEILEPLTQVQLPRRKIVRFRGLFDKTDTGLALAVRAFHDWGFQVQVVVDTAQTDLPWLATVDWMILKTTKPFVAVFSNELWYQPAATDDLPVEPKLPDPAKTLCYLYRGYSMTMTTKFIVSAKNNWALL